MSSRLVRVLFVVIAIVIGVTAGYFLKSIDTKVAGTRGAANTLRDQSGALLATLADIRAAQAAYVARGQGEEFWMSRVSKLIPVLDQQLSTFKAALTSPTAQASLESAAAAIDNFHKLDGRAQEYVRSGDALLASDLIFSDGVEAMATATTQVRAALEDELRGRDASAADLKMRELTILGGGGAGVLLILMMLGFSGALKAQQAETVPASVPSAPSALPAPPEPITVTVDPGALLTASNVCTEMARVTEPDQLPALLERTAKILDASGIIVWVADPSGRELRPALLYGYSDQVMARMGSIPRDATNAAASAYRAGALRTAKGKGVSNGAIVAPLLTADGCIGVLSAEMKGGSEKDESSQALTSIFAAQLATLVSPPSSATLTRAAEA